MPLRRLLTCLCLFLCSPLFADHTDIRNTAETPLTTQSNWEEFGRLLQTTLINRDWETLGVHLDSPALTDRILKNIPVSPVLRREFESRLKQDACRRLITNLASFPTVRFQRVFIINGEHHLRIRCSSDNGFTFLSFICKAGEGRIKWLDVFSFSSGELTSDSMHRAVLPLLTGASRNPDADFSEEQKTYLKNLQNVQAAVRMLQNGDPAAALAQLDALPADLQSKQFVLLYRFRAAQKLSEENYLAAIALWERLRPDDPALDLVTIDSTFLRKDYLGTIARLDSLSGRLGTPDALLLAMKGTMLGLLGKKEAARAVGEEAIAIEPSLVDGYDLLMMLAADRQDYTDLTRLLRLLSEQFPKADLDIGIKKDPIYVDYLKSAEYRDWIASQPDHLVATPTENSDEKAPVRK